MVEQAGHALGKFEPHHLVGVVQVTGQARVGVDERAVSQRAVDPPGQHRRGQRRFGDHIGQQLCHLLPQPAGKKAELHVGTDAVVVGDRQVERTPHGLAGHHDLVRIEHAAAALRKLVDQPLREDLVAVREVEVEHGVGIAAAGCVL